MALSDTTAKLKEKTKSLAGGISDSIFKVKNSKIAEKYGNYANMLLYGKNTNAINAIKKNDSKTLNDNFQKESIQPINNSESPASKSDGIISTLNKNNSEVVAQFKFISEGINANTEILRKIEINTKKTNALLDVFKKIKDKPQKNTTKTGNKFTDVDYSKQRTKPVSLLERAKTFSNKAKTYAKSSGTKAVSTLATKAKTLGGGPLSAITKGGAGRVALAGAAVAAAGAVGYGVGTLISKALPDSVNQAIGGAVARGASALGSDTASDAVKTQEKTSSGASLSPVKTEKIGAVSMPKDNNVKQAIDNASKLFKIPKEELYSVAQSESGFNPKAVNTKKGADAVGLFQFMPGTWNGLLKQNQKIAEQYNIGKASGKSLDDRADPYKAAIMYGLYRKGNIADLEKKGLSTGNKTVDSYLAHFLGGAGAKRVLEALSAGKGNEPIVDHVNNKQYKANPELMRGEDGKPRSINDFIKIISNKSAGKAEAYKKTFDKNPGITDAKGATASASKPAVPDAKGAIASASKPAVPDAKGATASASKPAVPDAKGATASAATKAVPDAKGATASAATKAVPDAKGATASAAKPSPMNVDNIKPGVGSDKKTSPELSSIGATSTDSENNLVDTVTVPMTANNTGAANAKIQPKGNFIALGDSGNTTSPELSSIGTTSTDSENNLVDTVTVPMTANNTGAANAKIQPKGNFIALGDSGNTTAEKVLNSALSDNVKTSTPTAGNNVSANRQANTPKQSSTSMNRPQAVTPPIGNNVKASGENIPMPIRDVPNTIQRILDKEYMRGV